MCRHQRLEKQQMSLFSFVQVTFTHLLSCNSVSIGGQRLPACPGLDGVHWCGGPLLLSFDSSMSEFPAAYVCLLTGTKHHTVTVHRSLSLLSLSLVTDSAGSAFSHTLFNNDNKNNKKSPKSCRNYFYKSSKSLQRWTPNNRW